MVVRIADRWDVSRKIGSGSFGDVFAGEDVITQEKVAIKRELASAPYPLIKHEYGMYQEFVHVEGFPQIKYGGIEGPYHIIVMERLGPTLKDLHFDSPGGRLPLRTVVYCAVQTLRRLRALHDRGIVFRDVKSGQFCVGRAGDDISQSPTIYMIDFGLAKWFIDEAGKHVTGKKIDIKRSKTGTARYASLNVHRGLEHSRRDDLESLAYVLIELVQGRLPWSNLRAHNPGAGWKKALAMKEQAYISELVSGLPDAFRILLEYARGMKFTDTPDYDMLDKLFADLYEKLSPRGPGEDGERPLVWEVEAPANGGW
ncbi:kinase-like domain-containing protein [Fimicolochytrium jonesii]|uniref:kinase-like domain-containing protein n=1 Tax=Fimicolochytrium jonesii TaxID=1396493 RepID=UPI0022FE891B|nr:kinase-like domain-containing protein [Fimicolochytrium jonesii]KAI8825978.1 kinase-like domain-containing protein [Fimicolochytrium jonesii]